MTTSIAKKGSLLVLLALAGPAIAEQILLTAVGYVDAAMVGSLGAGATAAVSINSSPQWFVNGIFTGVGVGYSVQVAHAIGAREQERARGVIRQSMLASIVVGVGVALVCLLLSRQLPVWMGAGTDILKDARAYLLIYVLAIPFAGTQAILSAIMRCMGNTRTPLFIGLFTNLLNVVLNVLFIFQSRTVHIASLAFPLWGAGLGVAGAALATAAANCVGAVLLVWTIYSRPSPYQIFLKDDYRPSREIIARAFHLGAPAAMDRVIICSGQIIMTKIVASLGTVALAANYVAVTAEAIGYLPAYGISYAATALVGQSIGAGDKALARKYGTLAAWVGFLFTVGTSVLLYVCSIPLASVFSGDPAVIALGARMLRIVALSEPLFGVSIVLAGALRGAGDVRWPFYFSVIGMWVIRMTFALLFVFVFNLGLAGIWFAMMLDIWFRGIACIIRFQKGSW